MKKFLFIFSLLLASLSAEARETVIVLITQGEVFYFQVGKVMKDGQIEVYDPAGKLISSHLITGRRMTIELLDLTPGEYVIKVVKQSVDHTFDFQAGNAHARVAMRDEITVSLKIEANETKLSYDSLAQHKP